MKKILKNIEENEIRNCLKKICDSTPDSFFHTEKKYLITLTNGNSFISHINIIMQKTPKTLVTDNDAIEISLSPSSSVYIPLSDISGIISASIEQNIIINQKAGRVLGGAQKGISLLDISKENIKLNAIEYGWNSQIHRVSYRIGSTKPFEWGDLVFSENFPLYWDREYIIDKSGVKINSLGVGVSILSVSAGWTKGLWKDFNKLFKLSQSRIEDCPNTTPFLVSGYIDFFDFQNENEEKKALLEMEGKKWLPAVISKKTLKDNNLTEFNEWQYCFFREDGFFLDKRLWENMKDTVSAVCEYVPATLKGEHGERAGFFKVRAAAYFK